MRPINLARTPQTPAEIPQHAESSTSAAPGERTPPLDQTRRTSGLLGGLFRCLPGRRARHPSTLPQRDEGPADPFQSHVLPQLDSGERARSQSLHRVESDPRVASQQEAAALLELATFSNATSLNIERIPLPRLPEQTFRLSHLQTMVIRETGLEELPESIGDLTNLRTLTLSHNPISALPASISGLEQLLELSVISCPNLSELPKDLAIRNASGQRVGLVKLQTLELSNTGVRSLPRSLRYMKDLKEIKITDSPLDGLDSSIHGLPKLEKLDLSGCKELERYPRIFQALAPLKKIILRNCSKLRSLPHDIHRLSQLQELDLRGCDNLRALPVSIFRLPADCTILVPPRLQIQLNRLRSIRPEAPPALVAAGASSYAATSSNRGAQEQARNRIDDTAHSLLDVVLNERNPFVAGAPFFIRKERSDETFATLGGVSSIAMMLDESKSPYFLQKLARMAQSLRERAINSGTEASDLDAATNDWKALKNSHLGIVDENGEYIFRGDSEINIVNLSKAVQMWRSREMLVLEDPGDREHFPEISLHIPDEVHEAHEDAGND
ncbi:hypothetical protein KCU57_08280 [Xanthomonas translucens]|uniref:type III secretion system leucine-rich repeat domain-containing effector XopL n=1 Tax=Xanthomonas campestris pv. translucens TaxID=343 RepID=UPI001F315E70|nr:type III secretion system leucine-rich repeat domain-containing effector XopL [Xanthomonas translucens]UKE52253.1 hypothetical protein KCU57_08280 [Xanthomonas translucens]